MSSVLTKILRALTPTYHEYLYMCMWGPAWLPPHHEGRTIEDPR